MKFTPPTLKVFAMLIATIAGILLYAHNKGLLPSNALSSGSWRTAKSNDPLVTIRVSQQQRYQTMEGFGGYGARDFWWHSPPHFDPAFIDMLINDLGITVLRDSVPFGFLSRVPDDFGTAHFDPLTIDLTARVDGDEATPIEHFEYLKAMHDAGLQKLVVSIWSPPPWMKHNRQLNNGSERTNSAPAYTHAPNEKTNQLDSSKYAEFAEFCVAYIKLLKLKTGIDLYAISLQNEPRFSQFYASAVYDPQSLAVLIQAVGDRFRKENIVTKIFAPEDMNIPVLVTPFLNAIIQHPSVSQYVHALAVHDYKADGIRPHAENSEGWKNLAKIASGADKAVWMTETSGYDSRSIEDGIALARSIHDAIKFGNASLWLYWQMSVVNDHGLIVNGNPTYLYHISKQFYRFIRPGFVRVSATSTDPEILVLAFLSPTDQSTTVILINTARYSRSVQFDDDIHGCQQAITTNSTANFQPLIIQNSQLRELTLTGLSVTSLRGCQ